MTSASQPRLRLPLGLVAIGGPDGADSCGAATGSDPLAPSGEGASVSVGGACKAVVIPRSALSPFSLCRKQASRVRPGEPENRRRARAECNCAGHGCSRGGHARERPATCRATDARSGDEATCFARAPTRRGALQYVTDRDACLSGACTAWMDRPALPVPLSWSADGRRALTTAC